MSITDELREYALGWDERNRVRRDLTTIADRIDAEHGAALLNVHTDLMDASGWVRLPKDADGEYIRVGDKLIDKDDTPQKPAIVNCILYNDDGCVVSDIDPRGCWYDPSLLRHYHAPTVEDVLREFSVRVLNSGHQWGLDGTEVIAEYAAKLRLAEGEDA